MTATIPRKFRGRSPITRETAEAAPQERRSVSFSNAIATTDAAGNVKLDKEKSRLKIDGAYAAVNAIAAAIGMGTGNQRSVYEERGVRCV